MNITNTPKERLYFLVARYFRFWANISLHRWHPKVIAITGSTGKTTLLQILETQLETQAHFSHDANSIYGIAFDILGLHGVKGSRIEWLRLALVTPWRAFTYTRHEPYYVVEIDGGRPGGAAIIAEWLQPSITALIGIEESHAAFFDQQIADGTYTTHIDAIAAEFMTIPRHTSEALIVDSNDTVVTETVAAMKNSLPSNVIAVKEASFLKNYEVSLDGTRYTTASGIYQFSYPMPRAVWTQLAMTEEILNLLKLPVATHDLAPMTLPPGRSTVLAGKKGSRIIDSSYNAQLGSMIATLAMFKEIKAEKKWTVIGDIIELGSGEAEQHRKLGEFLANYPSEHIILVGRRLKRDTAPLLAGHDNITVCDDAHEALAFLEQNLTGGETILFKGSQHLEWIIMQLLENPADKVKLPRQTPADYARRKKLGYL